MPPNHRRCLACRCLGDRAQFWRVVRVGQTVVLDQGMGRSAYLCPTADCLRLAERKNRLGRSLRAPISPELYQRLWQRLATPGSPPLPNEIQIESGTPERDRPL